MGELPLPCKSCGRDPSITRFFPDFPKGATVRYAVGCYACSATGPAGANEAEATRNWNALHTEARAPGGAGGGT